MRIAVLRLMIDKTIPAIEALQVAIESKSKDFASIIKTGRTHLMDATPIRLGDEFSAFAAQLDFSVKALKNVLHHLSQLPVGGTAVGTGLNTPAGYAQTTVKYINQFTNHTFFAAKNKFEGMASQDAFVEMSGALKQTAISLTKIANDIRLLASGPECGLGELNLPANEPGSSIMPGKVNPTQCEAMTMVCAQILGNDTAINFAAIQGHLQLNTFMPVIAYNSILSLNLLCDACHSFRTHCIDGITPNTDKIKQHLTRSLMLVTALSPHIGYHDAALIAQYAHRNRISLKEAALKLNLVSPEDFDKWVDPAKMV
jgi:fumarate hydratase class II